MVKWYCNSSLCFNNFKSRDENGLPLKFYRLPKQNKQIQAEYQRFFKTTGLNWKNGHICAAHWSSGERKTHEDLPDIAVPVKQLEILEIKYKRAKKSYDHAEKPTLKQKLAYKKAKQKLITAKSIFRSTPVKRKIRKTPPRHNTPRTKKPRELSKPQYKRRLDLTTESVENLTEQLSDVNKNVEQMEFKIKKLKNELKDKKKTIMDLGIENLTLQGTVENLKSKQFLYQNLKKYNSTFEYLCGLNVERFELLMECIRPYLEYIPYADCKGPTEKSFDYETQYLIVLTVCRHGLDLRFMSFMVNKSETTVQRIFNSWVIFLATLFNRLDLRPGHGFLLCMMPKVFVDTGHGLTDVILDATEFKFQYATNFELNSLMFSHYKNTATGKALIGISPHGGGVIFSDIYPGSISDSDITEKTGVLQFVNEEHEIMTDRGFAIQDLCAIKGVLLNRPKQKDSSQFSQREVQINFDIAATRIHVERFIGRVRDWTILNKVWPLNRMDLLSSTWQMLCHTVNITMPPIGPKSSK